jgi:hypothetical protein
LNDFFSLSTGSSFRWKIQGKSLAHREMRPIEFFNPRRHPSSPCVCTQWVDYTHDSAGFKRVLDDFTFLGYARMYPWRYGGRSLKNDHRRPPVYKRQK